MARLVVAIRLGVQGNQATQVIGLGGVGTGLAGP